MLLTKGGEDAPAELADAIAGHADREAHWSKAKPSCQARYAGYVNEAKKPEARARRVETVLRQMADYYERHTPPGEEGAH